MNKQKTLEIKENEDWKKKKIEEVFQGIKSGGTPKRGKKEYWENGCIPFVKIEDLNRQKKNGISDAEEYTTKKAVVENKTKIFNPGTILVTIYGVIGETGIVKRPVATNQAILGLWNPIDINTIFAKYALDFEQKRLSSKKRRTTQANIGKNILKLHEIPYPPRSEQEEIASVLYNLDRAIQKTEEIIEQVKRVKRGVIQHLFTEGYFDHEEFIDTERWGKIPNDWGYPQFSKFVDVNPSYSVDKTKISYIEMDALSTELPEPSYVGKRNPSEYSGKYFKEQDTLFPRITPCTENGKLCYVEQIKSDVGIGSTEFIVLSPKNEKIIPKFIYHVSKSHEVRNYAISRMRGSTGRQRVPYSVFKSELNLPLPDLPEQQKIIEILDLFDNEIRKNRAIDSQLYWIKKGLMQDLLTGKVRTKNKPIEVLPEVKAHG